MKTDFFHKLLFSASTKKLKTAFFEILIILKKLSKHVKTDFFSEKSDFFPKNAQTNAPNVNKTLYSDLRLGKLDWC